MAEKKTWDHLEYIEDANCTKFVESHNNTGRTYIVAKNSPEDKTTTTRLNVLKNELESISQHIDGNSCYVHSTRNAFHS